MRSSRWLWLAVALVAPACNLYNLGLLEEATGDDGPSGGTASGGTDGTTGGGPQDGGTTGDGGTGAAESGGDTGDGGMGFGGEGDGGTESGGGTGGAGGGSGGGSGGSTGGSPPSVVELVDDLSSGALIYNHAPFNGEWTRYGQSTGITWVPAAIDGMIVEEGADYALHVNATFTVSSWGVDIVLPLQSNAAQDIGNYDGIRFRAMRPDGSATTGLRVAVEDAASHRGSTLCTPGTGGNAGTYDGADCDNHAAAPLVPLTTSWGEKFVRFEQMTSGVSGARVEDLDLTKVYALHFQMDPAATNPVDFWIDDIYLFED